VFHPFTGPEVAVVKVAVAFQTPDQIDAVRALFKGSQNIKHIDLAGARNENDFNV
jgi:hypothetical protein